MKEDIESVQEDCTCPDLEMVKSEIQQTITASDKLTTAKQVQMQASHSRVFRVGTSTLVYQWLMQLPTAKQVQMQASHSRVFRVGTSTLVYQWLMQLPDSYCFLYATQSIQVD